MRFAAVSTLHLTLGYQHGNDEHNHVAAIALPKA